LASSAVSATSFFSPSLITPSQLAQLPQKSGNQIQQFITQTEF
jgi:hypothetical protein